MKVAFLEVLNFSLITGRGKPPYPAKTLAIFLTPRPSACFFAFGLALIFSCATLCSVCFLQCGQ